MQDEQYLDEYPDPEIVRCKHRMFVAATILIMLTICSFTIGTCLLIAKSS